ncbi:MAG: hypothetical protein LBU05_00145 [Bifidobacteriaceae bacterium]|jgi:hypothetical protein|nr:hypothetical protein [Bifidobacteriaceae bacterium]
MRDTDRSRRIGGDPANPARRVAAVAAVVALTLGTAAGVWGLCANPAATRPSLSPAAPSPQASPDASPPVAGEPLAGPVGDPEEFARQVAAVLFDWDTLRTSPAEIRETLIAWGDPSGVETAGLAGDIGGYLPDQPTWAKLGRYGTTQRLGVDTIRIPLGWEEAKAAAKPGDIPDGAAAYTITGVRRRDGAYQGEPVHAEQPVSFTLFVACAPAWPECHLLRLSQLDNPLR